MVLAFCHISSLLCGLSIVQPPLLQLFYLHLHPPSYIFPLQMGSQWHYCTVDPLVIQFHSLHGDDMTDGSPPHEPLSTVMLVRLKWLKPMQVSMEQRLIDTWRGWLWEQLLVVFSTSPLSFCWSLLVCRPSLRVVPRGSTSRYVETTVVQYVWNQHHDNKNWWRKPC